MAVSTTFKVTGLKEFDKRLRKVDPERNPKIPRRALDKAALLTQKIAAKEMIVTGRPRGSAPLPNKLTNRHGGEGLVGSIAVNRSPLPKAIEIGTELVYGAVHEKGLRGFPKRPFLKPALDKASRKFGGYFEREIARANRK